MRLQGHLQLQSIIQPFDIAFAIKKFNFCGASFKRILAWKDAFPNRSSQNDIPPFLILIHLPYSKYKGVKIYFICVIIKIKSFHSCVVLVSFRQRSCRTCVARLALVSHLCRTRVTSVSLVLLVLHLCYLHSCCSRRTRVARVWRSCCKLDQIHTIYRHISLTETDLYMYSV